MSAVVRIDELSAYRGERTLFDGLDLTVGPGDVVGLVGANGAGKSTLLAIVAGEGTAEHDGTVTLTPSDATVGYLAQEVSRIPGETVEQFLQRRTGVRAAEDAMNTAAESLGDADAEDLYTPALEKWLALGGADLPERAESVLAGLGLETALDTEMAALSGGQAARASLAGILLARYDVLLLDEPTNDLDLAGLEQLENFVSTTQCAVMIVSHDREFLARTVTGIVELDLAQQQIAVYDGGYEAYLVERDVARRHAREEFEQYADTKSGLEDRARMQRNWLEHGVRNARRKSKDNDKASRKVRAESTEKQAAKARQTQRRIERLDVVEEPRKEWELRMEIAAAPRSGSVVVSLNNAVVERESFRLGPVTAQIDAGDRIIVTGANGSGKTTLLHLLLGRITPTSGSVNLGSGVEIGEMDQARSAFDGTDSVADALAASVPDWPDAEVRTLLAKFGLRGQSALRPSASLSPGERTRAGLALLQARGVNLLVLDEPTNHLDVPAIEQLESALESYEGTLLLVTHDRRMLDSVRGTRQWTVESGLLHQD
ncbi:heme ABC transporter ATP-binding protein [Rhodococcus sp. Leaf7]|uniref:ABC-F family ATP-binding cassette domain-containing protein n=1 Tax=unclassified Rhodococcus (in: high G+C Gram-positive bacteria) TaxID=192944 RepID=UPI0006FADC40|nr:MULTISPECIES: ABC-F family ATP-binding cassette domain-containing protein [unclassified Rhodococcus (in: high G+C Gram-positive bacteria)]KQU06803.1 heme ABC transporter ATP-binding protein [Rhodococcus sp. Leaf7]KQU42322.1 heme ABC transporter ATP-binding protein [Rhodococcus sp. Leaf247]